MEKPNFKELFEKAMKDDTLYFCRPEGASYTEKAQPTIIIRDFRIEEFPDCDSNFTKEELKEAESFFEEVFPFCRVMSVSGVILWDYYCEIEKKEVA
jgi:hypothetical protein